MSYRTWPAAVLTGAALAAACVVVGEHVVQASDGCLNSTGWFTATPVAWPYAPGTAEKHIAPQDKEIGTGRSAPQVSNIADPQEPSSHQISGCLDLDRIQVVPHPTPDGRA